MRASPSPCERDLPDTVLVAPDADVFIGFLNPDDAHHGHAVAWLGPSLGSGDVVVGASVYAEAMVRPLRVGRPELVEDLLAVAGISVLPITQAVARRAAALRADHRSLRLPDALALASALDAGARFLTFDARLAAVAATEGAGPALH